ncbi:MAG: hypothetical protein NC124_18775 [Clostridium sp.]|nr:hypothetical protein [Clostridium sp.]
MKDIIKNESMKDMLRKGIVEKSVEILRRHGKKDDEIRKMMQHDFSISETVLDAILKNKRQDT